MIYQEEAYEIIGACMEVHRILGHGFLEAVYHDALKIELKKRAIPYKSEEKLQITYKDIVIDKYYQADFICYDKIILEIKAIKELTNTETSQVLNYIKATGFRLGILVNFGQESLEHKRYIK
mgnify:CR=1 FL=1